jgi:colanic acid/amylovoran biosynthesis glycosyltransferase
MRIAFFLSSFPAISETFILYQIIGLIDLGHEVDIYAEVRPGPGSPIHPEVHHYNLLEKTTYLSDFIPEASGYWEMPVWPASGETWIPGNDTPIQNKERIEEAAPHLIRCLQKDPQLAFEVLDPEEYGVEARSLSALYRMSVLSTSRKKYDVIHAHFGPVANMFRFVKQLWDTPMIATFHGYDFSCVPQQQGCDVYKNLFRALDAVTVNSQYAAECLKRLGCPPERIHHINVGLNIDDFPFRERVLHRGEPIKILTVGRLVEKKGIDYAIRAIAELKEYYPSLQYHIVGEGPLRPLLEDLVRECNLGEQVILHGSRDGKYVRKLMEDSHIFVLTSITASNGDQEGTPVSLMEAQASGLPVISTFHSGIPEIVTDQVSGFLVQERDADALADRLTFLVQHPEMWPAMGRMGRLHMEASFDITKLNVELAKLYEKTARFQPALTPPL